jgi:nitrite reductase (NADH) small subunit
MKRMSIMSPFWVDVGAESDIAPRSGRRVTIGAVPIGVFRTGEGSLFALIDRCPHKQGPLSDGIVHGRAVACPLHNWVISLETGRALGADEGCTPTLPVIARDGRILIDVQAVCDKQ